MPCCLSLSLPGLCCRCQWNITIAPAAPHLTEPCCHYCISPSVPVLLALAAVVAAAAPAVAASPAAKAMAMLFDMLLFLGSCYLGCMLPMRHSCGRPCSCVAWTANVAVDAALLLTLLAPGPLCSPCCCCCCCCCANNDSDCSPAAAAAALAATAFFSCSCCCFGAASSSCWCSIEVCCGQRQQQGG